jgi:hypothetical protein
MNLSVVFDPNGTVWKVGCEGDAAGQPPFCSEITGRDSTWKWKRNFLKRWITDPPSIAVSANGARAPIVRWYQFAPRKEPYLLDIRCATRGYYVLHAGLETVPSLTRPELCRIDEKLLGELVDARNWVRGALIRTAPPGILSQIERQNALLRASATQPPDQLLSTNTVDAAVSEQRRRALMAALNEIGKLRAQLANQTPTRAPRKKKPKAPGIVDRNRIRRVHLDN